MGIDAEIYGVGDITDARLHEVEQFFLRRGPEGFAILGEDGHFLNRRRDPRIITLDTLSRWYGPGYERGSWPDIALALETFRRAAPELTIYYEDDTTCEFDQQFKYTPELAAEMWDHYFGPHGDAYHDRWRNQ